MHLFSVFLLMIFTVTTSSMLSSCSSVSKVMGAKVTYDHAQNFEAMQRYNFSPPPDKIARHPDYLFVRDAGAVLAIENAMAAKQIRKERYGLPDFWLNYYFTGEQSLSVGQLNTWYGYNLGLSWNDEYGTGKGIANNEYQFSQRTLIIDLVSKEGNRLIWRGSTPTGLTEAQSERQKKESLNSAVQVILAQFPPQNFFRSLKKAVPD